MLINIIFTLFLLTSAVGFFTTNPKKNNLLSFKPLNLDQTFHEASKVFIWNLFWLPFIAGRRLGFTQLRTLRIKEGFEPRKALPMERKFTGKQHYPVIRSENLFDLDAQIREMFVPLADPSPSYRCDAEEAIWRLKALEK